VTAGTTGTRFDGWARSYDESPLRPAYEAAHRAVLDGVTRVGVRPRRVLDVGRGTGLLLRAAAGRFTGALLVGVDVSAGMLAAASSVLADRALLVQGRAERLPFRDAVFDLAVPTWSVRHWADPVAGVGELARVLAPGGLFAFADGARGGRRGIRWWRSDRCPAWLRPALGAAGLPLLAEGVARGCGPIPDITVVIAHRGAP
jgi:ubiquinone/menaquinone biosynthesis C-methylase UbiE